MVDPQRAVQPAQREQERHGRNERADEADRFCLGLFDTCPRTAKALRIAPD